MNIKLPSLYGSTNAAIAEPPPNKIFCRCVVRIWWAYRDPIVKEPLLEYSRPTSVQMNAPDQESEPT